MVSFRCETCRWWDRGHESLQGVPENYGYCRKHYPVIYQREGHYYGGWPLTDRTDLCGEYKADEEQS